MTGAKESPSPEDISTVRTSLRRLIEENSKEADACNHSITLLGRKRRGAEEKK